MRPASSFKAFVWSSLPFLTTIAVAGTGVWLLSPQRRLDDPVVGIASVLLDRAPLVCPLVVGVAAGVAVWLARKSSLRQHQLKAANRALEQANQQLQQDAVQAQLSEQRFQLLFSSNPCPMFILDCETLAITGVNEAALQQYGYSQEEFLRLTALDLRAPEEHERFLQQFRKRPAGYGFRGVWTHQRKDGSPL